MPMTTQLHVVGFTIIDPDTRRSVSGMTLFLLGACILAVSSVSQSSDQGRISGLHGGRQRSDLAPTITHTRSQTGCVSSATFLLIGNLGAQLPARNPIHNSNTKLTTMSTNEGQALDERSPTSSLPDYPMWAFGSSPGIHRRGPGGGLDVFRPFRPLFSLIIIRH